MFLRVRSSGFRRVQGSGGFGGHHTRHGGWKLRTISDGHGSDAPEEVREDVRVTPRCGYSETCVRGTPANVTAQMGTSLAGPSTMAADLVGPTPNLKRHFLAHAAITSQDTCKWCSQSATTTSHQRTAG